MPAWLHSGQIPWGADSIAAGRGAVLLVHHLRDRCAFWNESTAERGSQPVRVLNRVAAPVVGNVVRTGTIQEAVTIRAPDRCPRCNARPASHDD
ncbi:hypothetical protein GCM10010470_08630 [Saccharopolyspora taberi]|uniref:Uncharacterized protein n=1 Tax=Saccharopolyspora taberi TaxID=60895 RepID=A0ABN3V4J6_9PSEU